MSVVQSAFSLLRREINSFALLCGIVPSRYLSGKKEQNVEELVAALNRQISEHKKYLSRHSHTTYHSKRALLSVEVLSKELANIHEMRKTNTTPAVPCSVSIEIVSNGTTHLRPCVVIHTNYKDYLFNCPEGTSRFLAANRLKANNLTDIFFTRDTWDHFAGVSGLLKTPATVLSMHSERIFRLHERPLSRGFYSDDAITVHFIPVSSFSAPHQSVQEKFDVAFLVELKPMPRGLDIKKIKELRIPSGPHMKQLKDGEDVTLPDGRSIKAEDVLSEPKNKLQHACLIVECSDLKKLSSLENNTLLRTYNSGSKNILKYIVHFTDNSVINTERYALWMDSFGENVEHIIVNGTGPCLPHMESLYRINVILNYIFPKVFPLLHPNGFNGSMQQDDECERNGNRLYARPFQRFFLRRPVNLGPSPPNVSLIRTDILLQLKERSEITEAVDKFRRQVSLTESTEKMPRISFLGTSSAVPSNYRNVSGYLLQFNEKSCVLVDCGEGSYGQMCILYGDKACEEMLLGLSAVFITHGHQDHFHGIFTLVQRRKETFIKKGVAYKPLIVVAGRHILRVFHDVNRSFENYTNDMHIVDMSKMFWILSKKTGSSVEAVELVEELPPEVASAESLGFKSIVAVKVNHARNAVGYVFTDLKNQKYVFSGDTMPCEQLVNHGKDALILVHESTFADDETSHALYKKHSTMKQAFDIATQMNAKNLVLTHFSAKYPKVPPLPDYIEKAGNVTIAMDNMIVTPSDLVLTAKLIPVLREVFIKEISVIYQRSLKRHVQDDILARSFVDTLDDIVEKKKTENIASLSGPISSTGQ